MQGFARRNPVQADRAYNNGKRGTDPARSEDLHWSDPSDSCSTRTRRNAYHQRSSLRSIRDRTPNWSLSPCTRRKIRPPDLRHPHGNKNAVPIMGTAVTAQQTTGIRQRGRRRTPCRADYDSASSLRVSPKTINLSSGSSLSLACGITIIRGFFGSSPTRRMQSTVTPLFLRRSASASV